MNLSGIWAWLAPLLKPSIDDLLKNLTADEAGFIAAINGLVTKDEPSVLAVVTKWVGEIPIPGFIGSIFGSEVRSVVIAYVTSTIVKLIGEGESLEQPAFDELVAKLEQEVASVGL